MTDTATSRWVQGPFAPVTEEVTAFDLAVTGTLPPELDGRYLRNGPNPIGPVDPAKHHWFVGDGMVHGVRLRDGRAEWYRNRWVRGSAVSEALGEPKVPGGGVFGDVANTNVIGHAGRTFAIVEAGGPIAELDDELGTRCFTDLDGTLPNGFTAHPKRDPETGELHAVSYSFTRGNTVQYSVIGVDGRAKRTVDITVHGSPMMHDFSLTERHVIFYDLPVTFDAGIAAEMAVPRGLRLPARLLLSSLVGRVKIPDPVTARQPDLTQRDRRMPYSWNPKYPARVGVMPREFNFPFFGGELWIPFVSLPAAAQDREHRFLRVIGLLKPGVSRAQGDAEIRALSLQAAQQHPATNSGVDAFAIGLNEDYTRGARMYLSFTLGAVAFVLLIACANVANLLLARGAARQKELAVRMALGAHRWRVMRQLLTESLLLALAGGVCGLGLSVWGVTALANSVPQGFARFIPGWERLSINGWALGFTVLASLVTGVLCGLLPAWQATGSRTRPGTANWAEASPWN